MSKDIKNRVNEEIRAKEVRLILDDGEQKGVIPTFQAMQIAQDRGLDLVEVAGNVTPPVCRVMDYGKFIYEKEKRAKEAKKKQKFVVIKEVKFKPNIDTHDYETKKRKIIEFLEKDYKVKVTMEFRGRENARRDQGRVILVELTEEIKEYGKPERDIQEEGRKMFLVLIKN